MSGRKKKEKKEKGKKTPSYGAKVNCYRNSQISDYKRKNRGETMKNTRKGRTEMKQCRTLKREEWKQNSN